MLSSWLRDCARRFFGKTLVRRRRPSARLNVESLECRTVLNAGGLDPTFGTVSTNFISFPQPISFDSEDVVRAVAVQPDGKIVAAGYTTLPNGERDMALTRYMPNGALDPSFGVGGKLRIDVDDGFPSSNEEAYDVAIMPDGRIVVVGKYTDPSTGRDKFLVARRLQQDGAADTTFHNSQGLREFPVVGVDDEAHAVAVQADGKIVVAGSAYDGFTTNFATVRLNVDGSTDGFGPAPGLASIVDFGLATHNDVAEDVLILPDGKIVVVGTSKEIGGDNGQFALVGLDDDGKLDANFGDQGKRTTDFGFGILIHTDDYARGAAVTPDGKIVVVGHAKNPTTNVGSWALARYTAGGDLDLSFSSDGKAVVDLGGSQDVAYDVAVQTDGKIVAVGTAFDGDDSNGFFSFGVARLNVNGSLDDGGANDSTPGDAFGLGGKSMIAVNGTNSFAQGIDIQVDGKIVVGGYTATNGGDFALMRLDDEGPSNTQAPVVTNPAAPLSINSPAIALAGTAEADSLVRVYRDVNGNGALDLGTDVLVGSQQLSGGVTTWNITVGLEQGSVNRFLVTAQLPGATESTAAAVPPITEVNQRDITATLVKKKVRGRNRLFVRVAFADTGEVKTEFRSQFQRPRYRKITAAAIDTNGDGTADSVRLTAKLGKKTLKRIIPV